MEGLDKGDQGPISGCCAIEEEEEEEEGGGEEEEEEEVCSCNHPSVYLLFLSRLFIFPVSYLFRPLFILSKL
jgi:hypothetical protein